MAKYQLDWNKYTETAVQAAAEGAVMLVNNNTLPIAKGSNVALFGRMMNHYYKSGTGSGGMVNVQHVVNIREGLENSDSFTVDKKLLEVYDEWEKENPPAEGVGWGKDRWSQDEMPLTEEVVKDARSRSDIALMVIARTAGEDRDNTYEKGSYLLSDSEEAMLSQVTAQFDKTVVLLNVGNIIDMSFVEKYGVSAVLYIWQSGVVGGTACERILSGKINPSGCLTDTIAKTIEDYPSDANFGKKDINKDTYQEDVFVGYRYFSTFAKDRVLYPFGAGLSYTTFALESLGVTEADGAFEAKVKVTNTGSVAGKKAVLIYVSKPEGAIPKPVRELVGFGKTDMLEPGASEVVTVTFTKQYLVSFDDANKAGLGNGWILEAGEYKFYAGGDVDSAIDAGSYKVDASVNVEPLSQALAPVEAFDRMAISKDENGNAVVKYEPAPVRTHENIDDRFTRLKPEIPYTGDKGIKLIDVKEGRNTLDEFIAQIDDTNLSLIIRGEGMSSPKVTTGTAGAFCGVEKTLKEMGVPAVCCSDGPSGMRIDSGKKAFALPNGTCLASSFNSKLITELFVLFGTEMVSNHIDSILGPGMNIHRHPLNGRNFEYFSEDPVVSGKIACAMLEGLHEMGVTGTIKHFCVNNRETNRRGMDTVVSERALREIYLRGFEIAVKEANAQTIMTVYNIINGTYGAGNYELNTMILREQWGYTGITMTDWWASIDKEQPQNLTLHSQMARAQNDLYMVCSSVDRKYIDEADTLAELNKEDGNITRAELQRNAANIIRFAMNTPAMNRLNGEEIEVEHIDCPFGDDDIDANADVFYDIEDGTEINVEEQVDTSGRKDFVFGANAEVMGVYEMEMIGVSDLNTLAQIPMTLFYTSIPINVMTWNGSEGKETTRTSKLLIRSKHAVFRLHFSGNGLKLKKIKFKYLGEITDEILKELM